MTTLREKLQGTMNAAPRFGGLYMLHFTWAELLELQRALKSHGQLQKQGVLGVDNPVS